MHLVLFKYLYLQTYDSYKKDKNGFEIYREFCFRTMYFYKEVEIDIFFKYSDFGQGESTLICSWFPHCGTYVLSLNRIPNLSLNSIPSIF